MSDWNPEVNLRPKQESVPAILTVAIPSYNRNSVLAENLERLLPQLTAACVLTIIDNASDTPLSETLTGLRDFTQCPANIIRNRVNIGANANLLRCIETCTTEWLWILGDDDPVRPNAIVSILGQVQSSPGCLYINFRSALCAARSGRKTGLGILEFARQLDSFSNALFISTSVFNAAALLPSLGFGYQYAYSCAPHLAVLLAAMAEKGTWCFSDEEIVDVVTSKTTDQKWSPLTPALGKMTLLELPMGHQARRLLGRKISAKPRAEYLVLSLVMLAQRRSSNEEALYLYRQLCVRLYCFDRSISGYFRRLLGRFLIRHWTLTTWVAGAIRRRLKGKEGDRYKGMMDQAGVDQWHRLL